MWQVVVGVLGCPNLPAGQINDEDGAGNSAAKAGTDGVGVIFAAQKGVGAFAGPLTGAQPSEAASHSPPEHKPDCIPLCGSCCSLASLN